MDVAIAHQVAAGAVLAQRGDSWAVFSVFDPGQRVAHGLHLLISILTCGLWLPAWIFIAVTASKPQRYTLRLDVGPDGRISAAKVS